MARDHVKEMIHLIAIVHSHLSFACGTFYGIEELLDVSGRCMGAARVFLSPTTTSPPLRGLFEAVTERLSRVHVAVKNKHCPILVTVCLVSVGEKRCGSVRTKVDGVVSKHLYPHTNK